MQHDNDLREHLIKYEASQSKVLCIGASVSLRSERGCRQLYKQITVVYMKFHLATGFSKAATTQATKNEQSNEK